MRRIFIGTVVLLLFAGISSAAPQEIKLPSPKDSGNMSVEEAILKRRSDRSYYPNELNTQQISQLLWAAQGITEKTWGWRAAPSAGSIYPLTVYLVNKDGVYEYFPRFHKLKLVEKGDKRPNLNRASLGQSFIEEAPVSLIIAADFEKNKEKYGSSRGPRYVFMEAGHVAQNVHLQAVSLGLGSVPIGAFWDAVAQSALNLPKNLDPIYIIPVGYPKQ